MRDGKRWKHGDSNIRVPQYFKYKTILKKQINVENYTQIKEFAKASDDA